MQSYDIGTYSPALRAASPVDLAVDQAIMRWPASPAESLTGHLFALRAVFATCPDVSRKSEWGRKHEAHFATLERAVERLSSSVLRSEGK
jgi:hypothetical protein